MDVHDPDTRSYNMSMIKAVNTKPELLLRKALFAEGYRYRLHIKDLPGKPDIVLRKYNTVIFVHGCFWHGHKRCKYFVIPKTRTKWWIDKINRNRERDKDNIKALRKEGWNIKVVWECELKPEKRKQTLKKLFSYLK